MIFTIASWTRNILSWRISSCSCSMPASWLSCNLPIRLILPLDWALSFCGKQINLVHFDTFIYVFTLTKQNSWFSQNSVESLKLFWMIGCFVISQSTTCIRIFGKLTKDWKLVWIFKTFLDGPKDSAPIRLRKVRSRDELSRMTTSHWLDRSNRTEWPFGG